MWHDEVYVAILDAEDVDSTVAERTKLNPQKWVFVRKHGSLVSELDELKFKTIFLHGIFVKRFIRLGQLDSFL